MNYVALVKWGFLFCVVFTFSGCRFHRPAYYPAQVRMKDGVPCFSVANRRKEKANPSLILTINVFRYASRDATPFWYQTFPPGQRSIEIFPHECMVYGKGKETAPPLLYGHRYGVSIHASINDEMRAYQSYFCLSRTPVGETEIHHVKWNRELNGFDWSVCGDKD